MQASWDFFIIDSKDEKEKRIKLRKKGLGEIKDKAESAEEWQPGLVDTGNSWKTEGEGETA